MNTEWGLTVSGEWSVPDVLRQRIRKAQITPAVWALAVYTFLVIGRAAELAPRFRSALLTGVLALVLIVLLPRRQSGFFGMLEVRAVLLLWGLALLTIPFSVWPGRSFQFVFSQFDKTILFCLAIVYAVRSLRDAALLTWSFLLGVAWIELMVLVSPQVEVTGYYDRNDTALLVVCALPLALFRVVQSGGTGRFVAAIIGALAIYTVSQSQSRGGFLGLLAVGAILLWRLPFRNLALKVGVITTGVVLFIWFAPVSYWERISTIWGTDAETVDEYDAGGLKEARLQIWKTGLNLMLGHPLLGVGAGSFRIAEGLATGPGLWEAPHNSFLQIGAELGIGGLALLLYLLYRAVKHCRTVSRKVRAWTEANDACWISNGIEVGIYGFIIGGIALSHAYTPFLYFLIGMAVALSESRVDEEPVTTFSQQTWWRA